MAKSDARRNADRMRASLDIERQSVAVGNALKGSNYTVRIFTLSAASGVFGMAAKNDSRLIARRV
jgi:hypothetical protein